MGGRGKSSSRKRTDGGGAGGGDSAGGGGGGGAEGTGEFEFDSDGHPERKGYYGAMGATADEEGDFEAAIGAWKEGANAEWNKIDYDPSYAPTLRDDTRAEYRLANRTIGDFVERSPKYDGDLYRAMDIPLSDASNFRTGGTFQTASHQGFSGDQRQALRFAGTNSPDTKAAVFMRIAKNWKGASIKNLGSGLGIYDDEAEVIVPKGTRYRIRKITSRQVQTGGGPKGDQQGRATVAWMELEEL